MAKKKRKPMARDAKATALMAACMVAPACVVFGPAPVLMSAALSLSLVGISGLVAIAIGWPVSALYRICTGRPRSVREALNPVAYLKDVMGALRGNGPGAR